MLTDIKLADVNGTPVARLDLPSQRLGDPVKLRFRIQRQNGGRFEVLDVNTTFRVTSVGCDASAAPHKQLLAVETASGRPPTWRSIKKPSEALRRLPPAIFPRTPV